MKLIPHFLKIIRDKESQPCVLKKCSVVIDGPSFLYNLYRQSRLNFEFGCETDKFAVFLKSHLQMFKDANVKCYFLFNGGNSAMSTKLYYLENETSGDKFDFTEHNKFVPPLLLSDVYRQVLDDMGVPYAVCQFECKRECVALAEQLQCPVISSHIDFCFMKAPYIQHQTLKYNHQMGEIECLQFNRDDFLNKYSLTEQKLAIFAVLTDTNRISPDYYDHDLANILENRLKMLGALVPNYHKRYTALWRWLAARNESATLAIIYKSLNKNGEEKFAYEMNRIMELMQTKRIGFAADYLLNGDLDFVPNDPDWFEKGVASKRIAKPYINLYNHNYLFRQGVIKSAHCRPSMLLSMDIVKFAYNLLTDFKKEAFTFIIKREEVEIVTKRTAPSSIQTPVFANGWDDINQLGLFEMFLEENSIDLELVSQAPNEAAVLLIALVYFARKKAEAGFTVTGEVYSILTCFTILMDNPDIPRNDRDEAKNATRSYFNTSYDEIRAIFDRELLHIFVEFQQCLQQLNNLNVLCGSPYAPTVYHRAYNGTFVYKLFYEMNNSGDDCDTYINKVFSSSTSVLDYMNRLISLYKMFL